MVELRVNTRTQQECIVPETTTMPGLPSQQLPRPCDADELADYLDYVTLPAYLPSVVADSADDHSADDNLQQWVTATDDASQPIRTSAQKLEQSIRQFWDQRGEEGQGVQQELNQLRHLLFRRKKFPVEEDVWCPGAAQRGEPQHIEAVVSEVYVLKQLQDVIHLRETWLRDNDFPLDFQMRDKLEMPKFLEWAKSLYHSTDFQVTKQKKDFAEKGNYYMTSRMRSRWNCELQRRCGTTQLWHMVVS